MRTRKYKEQFLKIWFFDDKELRNKIILEYLDKVKSYMISYGDYLSSDELTNDAYIMLDTLIGSYLYSKNPSFDSYLEKEVKKILTNHLEESREFISYNDLIHTTNNNSLLDNYIVFEDMELINRLLNILLPIEKMVVKLYFGLYDDNCYKIDEISKILRIKETEVSSVLHSCINKIRQELSKDSNIFSK